MLKGVTFLFKVGTLAGWFKVGTLVDLLKVVTLVGHGPRPVIAVPL